MPPKKFSITLQEATLILILIFIALAYFTGWDQNLLN